MKKKSIVIMVVLVILGLVFGGFVVYKANTDSLGSNIAVKNSDGTETHKVYVGASSKLYESWDSKSSSGIFLDIFNDVKESNETLAKAIDEGKFPYAIAYVASTTESATSITRYLIQLDSGSAYWIEP